MQSNPSPKPIPTPTPRHPRLAEFALALGGFGIGTSEFVIMGLMNNVATDLAVSVPQVGYAISSYALGVVVGAPLISAFAAKVPKRLLLIVLMLVFAFGNLASAMAPDFWSFVALRFIAGLPHGAYFGVAALVAAAAVPHDQRAQAVSRVMLGLAVAILIGAPLGTWAGGVYGWQVAFAGVGVIALLTSVLIYLWVPTQPKQAGASPLKELSALLNQRVLMTVAVACIGCGGMFAVFSYVMPTLTEQAGMPEHLGPLVLVVFGVGSIIGNLVGGRAADINLMRAIPLTLVWCVVVQSLFFFAANHVWSGLLFVGLMGTCIALAPSLQTRLMDVAGEAQTMAASLNHAAFNGANAIGAWLAGLAISAGLSWSSSGLVGAGLALCGLGIFYLAVWLDRHEQPEGLAHSKA